MKKGSKHTKEVKQRIRESSRIADNSGWFKKGHSKPKNAYRWIKGGENPSRKKINRMKISKTQRERKRGRLSEEHKKKISIGVKKVNISEKMKEKWQEEKYVMAQIKARNVKQNKKENLLEKLLNEFCPKEYRFVGDGKFILGGKCPDFMNINGQKKLIELYGDYWHKNDNPQDRIDYFKKFGFDTLIIWESELKDLLKVKQRIISFT